MLLCFHSVFLSRILFKVQQKSLFSTKLSWLTLFHFFKTLNFSHHFGIYFSTFVYYTIMYLVICTLFCIGSRLLCACVLCSYSLISRMPSTKSHFDLIFLKLNEIRFHLYNVQLYNSLSWEITYISLLVYFSSPSQSSQQSETFRASPYPIHHLSTLTLLKHLLLALSSSLALLLSGAWEYWPNLISLDVTSCVGYFLWPFRTDFYSFPSLFCALRKLLSISSMEKKMYIDLVGPFII